MDRINCSISRAGSPQLSSNCARLISLIGYVLRIIIGKANGGPLYRWRFCLTRQDDNKNPVIAVYGATK
jgi:hypothetical protein